jgi:hypothetical protein
MISRRRPLLWYRGIRKVQVIRQMIDIAAFIGAAALLSYLVLQPHW